MSPEQGLLVTEFVSEQDGGSVMASSLVIANSCFLYKHSDTLLHPLIYEGTLATSMIP